MVPEDNGASGWQCWRYRHHDGGKRHQQAAAMEELISLASWCSGSVAAAIFGEGPNSNDKWQAANNQQPSAIAPMFLEGSIIITGDSTEGISLTAIFEALQHNCSIAAAIFMRRSNLNSNHNDNQQSKVSAAALVLSEGNNIMTDVSREAIAFSCILDSVVAHGQHCGSHFQRRRFLTAMMNGKQQSAGFSCSNDVDVVQRSSQQCRGKWWQLNCYAIPAVWWLMATMLSQKIRQNLFWMQNQVSWHYSSWIWRSSNWKIEQMIQ